jgi:hypothetical protein
MRPGGWTAGAEAFAGASGSQQGSGEAKRLERRAAAGDSPVAGPLAPPWRRCVSTAGHEEPRGKLGRPRSKAQYAERPIAHEYREGKVKSTPARGVKESLKPSAHSQREAGRGRPPFGGGGAGLIACLLKNEPASCSPRRGKGRLRAAPAANASPNRAPPAPARGTGASRRADPKPGELPMASVKVR